MDVSLRCSEKIQPLDDKEEKEIEKKVDNVHEAKRFDSTSETQEKKTEEFPAASQSIDTREDYELDSRVLHEVYYSQKLQSQHGANSVAQELSELSEQFEDKSPNKDRNGGTEHEPYPPPLEAVPLA